MELSTPSHPHDARRSGRFAWRRYLPWLSVAATLGLVLRYLLHNPEWFLVEAVFVVEVLAVTAVTRTTTAWTGVRYFARGIWLSMPLTLLIGQGLFGRLLDIPPDRLWMKGLVIPCLEECTKVAPVVAAAVWRAWKRQAGFAVSDWLMLSALSGAGFDIVEKLFYTNNFHFTYGPHLGPWYLFPDALGISLGHSAGWTGFVGHAAATGLFGVGIGLGLVTRRTAVGSRWWWAVPLVAGGWVIGEHGLWNLRLVSPWAIRLTPAAATPWLCLALAATAIVIDGARARRIIGASGVLRSGWAVVMGRAPRRRPVPMTASAIGRRVVGVWQMLRLSNTVAMAAVSVEPSPTHPGVLS